MAAKKKKKAKNALAAPAARPNTDARKRRARKGKLAIADAYIIANGNSPNGPALAAEVARLTIARDAVLGKVKEKEDLHAKAQLVEVGLVADDTALDVAITDYARAAGRVAKGDKSVLTGLAVDVIVPGVRGIDMAAGALTKLEVLPGDASGRALVRMGRPPGATAFWVQYKNEPSLPSDPWLPPEGLSTKHASFNITGLPPAQLLRVRARAIAGSAGPWSNEVVGRGA